MKSHWLNKNKNKNLIIFFTGWSFDFYPFKILPSENYDILLLYDYNNLTVPDDIKNITQYENKILISWSMGVYCAYILRNLFEDFNYKLAINGTISPVDNNFGIPVKMFELTLKHAEKGLENKFYQNIFLEEEDYNLYMANQVQRTIMNRVFELQNLYNHIKNKHVIYKNFYDRAIVCEHDKIIPPKNQIACHKANNVPITVLPYGHFPFYHFKNWDEIIKCQ